MFAQPTSYFGPQLVYKRRVGYPVPGQDLPRKMMRLTLTDAPKAYNSAELDDDELE